MRSSALSLAMTYVAIGIAALILFAAPLWYAWQVTIQESRVEILATDAQRLSDVYRRYGADGLKSFIDQRVGMQIVGERILLLSDASLIRTQALGMKRKDCPSLNISSSSALIEPDFMSEMMT